MVGKPVTKADIDFQAGNLTGSLDELMRRIINFKEYLDSTTEGDLIELGYTANDVAVMKTAFNDLAELNDIYSGKSSLNAPKDFTAFAHQLWGLGDV